MKEISNLTSDSTIEVNIRTLQKEEIEVFKKMNLQFYKEIDFDYNVDEYDEIVSDFLTKGEIIVAVVSNKIIGFVTYVVTNAIYAKGNFGVVNELYIVPDFRSKKLGQKLIDYVLTIAKKEGWKRIELDTPRPDVAEKALNFYLNEGFVTSGFRMKKVINK
ncbi:GNAT family N-acetyltransferase [Flavobacterium taihuense]|uniref:GNAT family N-acetyltransferase n=1 Tax=Flavobacterium taihuense TaxID=2857508 RepID=A0ABS6XW16_9FLAO|nr:GNAT family N-acetyltransferase [Flavobacterium taihuense]MBW4360842.1 GNAT family N-acetyltransferase [Flavobacterium taihuense]